MASNQDNKIDKGLENASKQVASILKAENSYKSSAWLIYSVMIVIAFFISLGNSDFDFSRILRAQFWIDFSVTFFGGLLIKFAWGKWGNAEGHRHPNVIKAHKDVEKDNLQIEEQALVEEFDNEIDRINAKRKLSAIKRKAFKILNGMALFRIFKRKDYWLKIKECILRIEAFGFNEETKKFLDTNNFDLKTFEIKYQRIDKGTVQTGYTDKGQDDEKMDYNEYYQLFGRNIYITLLSFFITIILAITSVTIDSLSGKTLFIFFTRFGVYSMNAYVGFSIAKSGVEKVKLNILKKIHIFLKKFLESNTKNKEVIK